MKFDKIKIFSKYDKHTKIAAKTFGSYFRFCIFAT